MEEIKVIVADDSGLMRLIISDIINSEPGMNVIETASNGKEAVEKTLKLVPDVLLLDMNMGEFDGLYAIRNILPKKKVPIVILSAQGNTNVEPVLEALSLGAFDYLNKPEKNRAKVRDISREIVQLVRSGANSGKRSLREDKSVVKRNQNLHTFSKNVNYDIIVIGSSTGGPTAIERIITKLPSNLPVPVLIAQHMPANFVPSFVNRLNTLTPLEVVMGRKGEVLKAGMIYIAPGSRNMIIVKDEINRPVIDFTSTQFKEFNNPSVNALMLSVAEVFGGRSIGAVLTGMGKDGAKGIEKIKRAGGYTIAQNQETCVVYGMPREVVEQGTAISVVSIYEMAGFMVSCLS